MCQFLRVFCLLQEHVRIYGHLDSVPGFLNDVADALRRKITPASLGFKPAEIPPVPWTPFRRWVELLLNCDWFFKHQNSGPCSTARRSSSFCPFPSPRDPLDLVRVESVIAPADPLVLVPVEPVSVRLLPVDPLVLVLVVYGWRLPSGFCLPVSPSSFSAIRIPPPQHCP